MSIKIDESRCVGCSACVEVCPGNLIKLRILKTGAAEQGTPEPGAASTARRVAHIKHERDCWGCTSCVKACPRGAVSFYLGADIGGRGARLTVETKGRVRIWRVTKGDGSIQEITVDGSAANNY